jgi:hypothetical protein
MDPEAPATTLGGLSGVQGSYRAPGRLGRYAVFLSEGRSIEVTINGTLYGLAGQLPDIEASIATIEQR